MGGTRRVLHKCLPGGLSFGYLHSSPKRAALFHMSLGPFVIENFKAIGPVRDILESCDNSISAGRGCVSQSSPSFTFHLTGQGEQVTGRIGCPGTAR
jgi:hypothetical protein